MLCALPLTCLVQQLPRSSCHLGWDLNNSCLKNNCWTKGCLSPTALSTFQCSPLKWQTRQLNGNYSSWSDYFLPSNLLFIISLHIKEAGGNVCPFVCWGGEACAQWASCRDLWNGAKGKKSWSTGNFHIAKPPAHSPPGSQEMVTAVLHSPWISHVCSESCGRKNAFSWSQASPLAVFPEWKLSFCLLFVATVELL